MTSSISNPELPLKDRPRNSQVVLFGEVLAVYLVGALRHWPTALTLERVNAFAAAVCGIRGAIPDDMNFYQPFSQAWT